FRVVAAMVRRQAEVAQPSQLQLHGPSPPRSASGNRPSRELAGEGAEGTSEVALPRTGTVDVTGKVVRFVRPGLVEEYTVSMDGVRQDFIIKQPPAGEGPLHLELEVSGAKVETRPNGAQLVLEKSGRRIAYSHLRVTDATGKELTAWMEVISRDQCRCD